MFFRRKKRPVSDQKVLTETLRSLQDLIEESDAVSSTGDPGTSTVAEDAAPAREAVATDPVPAAEEIPTLAPSAPAAPVAETATTPPETDGDDIPVLTEAVYMPIPRCAANTNAGPAPTFTRSSKQLIAENIMNSIESRLDGTGQSLDPRLSKALHAAVTACFEDWSTRTQEILIKQISGNTDDRDDGAEGANR